MPWRGYKILNSPLAETFEAAAEHFEKTDQDGEGQKPAEPAEEAGGN
jgi:hypothetical protein